MDHRPVDSREMCNIQGENKERSREQSEQREQRKRGSLIMIVAVLSVRVALMVELRLNGRGGQKSYSDRDADC